MSSEEFKVGDLLRIVYQGQDKTTPSSYVGVIEQVVIPKTTGLQLWKFALVGGDPDKKEYRSFYPHKAESIERVVVAK